jgi:hypothetical protein
MFKGQEEKDNFVNNFNLAFQKFNESERRNIEFSNLFEIDKKMKTIVYKHPIKQFVK